MVIFRPKKARFGENRHFWPLDGNNSKNLQNRYTNVDFEDVSNISGGAGSRWPVGGLFAVPEAEYGHDSII